MNPGSPTNDRSTGSRWRTSVAALRDETCALYFAARDPRTPWYAKLLVATIVAYALSPIDLVPDFIPVLGQLDDLVLLPIGIAIAIRLVPRPVLEEGRALAAERFAARGPRAGVGGVVMVALIWLVAVGLVALAISHTLSE
jgi:uncharacterized membrane protein YkvA (DUF1232 family)